METITVEIGSDGSTKVSTKGFKGKACKDATKQLEKALGKVTSDSDTPEMNERATVSH
jgi:hypothetical protein